MKYSIPVIVVALLATVCSPAWAWGPNTRRATVTTAMHLLSKQGVVQINKLEHDVLAGANAKPEDIAAILPGFTNNAFRAIEGEMRLLAAVRGNVIDPYMAYRLGLLGAQVAELTGPLSREKTIYRDRYYEDVDRIIQRVPLRPSTRKTIDPLPYLVRLQEQADARRDMIIKDYQEGTGFNGVAGTSIAEDAGRSVDAVANVWYTILAGTSAQASVSEAQIKEYVFAAMNYYISRGNEREIDGNYARLAELIPRTTDTAIRIGDLFYAAKMFERAIKEYKFVLQQEPNRREVVSKVASYYVSVGDQNIKEAKLRQGLDAYATAAGIDPLHPHAEAKRLKAEKLLAQRDARLELARRQIDEASKLQTHAEQFVLQRRHAEALTILKQAQQMYESVTDEFLVEYQAASAGLANISSRLRQIKTDLIQNAQSLSGAGTLTDLNTKVAADTEKVDRQALQNLLKSQLDSQMTKIKADYKPVLEIK